MSKKLITALLTVLTVMILTGCSNNKKAVSEAAEGFLNAMVSNDMDAAAQYATDDFMKSDAMKLMKPDYLADTFYAAMGVEKDDMDENTRQVVDEYMKKVVSKAYKSFEIEEVKILEDKASVTAKIVLGYNPEESSGLSDDTLELVSQYQKDHYDELVEIYTEEGEKAMYKKMYNDLIPIIIGKMQEALESSDPSEEKTVLSLVKVDNKWLVSDLEENRPQAANTEAKEEAAAAVSTAAQTEYADEDITSDENTDEGLTADGNAEEGSSAGHTAETGNTSEEAAEAGTTEGETGN